MLRAAGLRRTSARVAVLEHLLTAEAPLSHQELADVVEPLGFDRATIYRNLMDLTRVGLVERNDLGDHTWRFSIARTGEGAAHGRQHPHLVCVDCGTVVCLPDVKVKITVVGPSQKVEPANLEVQLRGACERCERAGEAR